MQENHLLGLHVFWTGAASPSVSTNTNYGGTGMASLFGLGGIGPQYSYYVMPLNLSLSAALVLTRATYVDAVTQTSNLGLGVRVSVGKEWWYRDHWGLGVAAQLGYASNGQPDGNGNTNALTSSSFTLAFSATYN